MSDFIGFYGHSLDITPMSQSLQKIAGAIFQGRQQYSVIAGIEPQFRDGMSLNFGMA